MICDGCQRTDDEMMICGRLCWWPERAECLGEVKKDKAKSIIRRGFRLSLFHHLLQYVFFLFRDKGNGDTGGNLFLECH